MKQIKVFDNFLLYLYNLPGHVQHGPGCSSQETPETGGWSAAYCSPCRVIVAEIHAPSLPPFNSLFSLYLPLPFMVFQPFLLCGLKNMTKYRTSRAMVQVFQTSQKQCDCTEIKTNAEDGVFPPKKYGIKIKLTVH